MIDKEKKTLRIDIVTITGEMNYGNSLQNYAVEALFQHLVGNARTVICEPYIDNSLMAKAKRAMKEILRCSNYADCKRRRRFVKFNQARLHFVLQDQLVMNNKDVVIFGSDQIWNFNYGRIADRFALYTGEPFLNNRKIAYSASIGANEIPGALLDRFSDHLMDFHSVSVREEQAASIICELTGRKVPVTIDPTLMLDAADWQRIEKKPRYVRKNERILLTYFLGDLSPARKAFVDAVAQQFGLRVVALQNEWAKDIPDPAVYATTPDEFIWLVHHCQLVLTDSFHGSVFSILFDKPFRCFGREESGVADMSSRMDTLFGKFGIGDWCRGSVQEDPDHIFYKDYASVPAVLEQERQFALNYLKNALEIHE